MRSPPPRLLATCVLALATSACTTTALTDRRPAPMQTQASAWQSPLPHGGRSEDLARWWSQFDDALLPELIAAAQQASPSIASAQARIERARAAVAASGAQAAPRVDAVASALRSRQAPNQPAVASASLGVQAAWEIDLFGGVAAASRASLERLRAAEAGWHDARVSLASDVATSYISLRACEAQLAQSRADAGSRDQTAKLTDDSARAGFTAPADAALVRAGAAQARSQARAQQAQCDTLVKALVELTDRSEPALRASLAASTARIPSAPAIAPAALPAQALAQRPDLAEASASVMAAAADVTARRADELPRVSLSGSLSLASSRSAGMSANGSVWSIGPLAVSLPLFDRGGRKAATAAAEAGYDEAVAQLQASVRRALREVEVALVSLEATGERERDVLAAAVDFEASLKATEARQRGGLASLLDLEAARRNAVLARSTLIELQRERAAAWIALYRGLGGGWTAADPVLAQRVRPSESTPSPTSLPSSLRP